MPPLLARLPPVPRVALQRWSLSRLVRSAALPVQGLLLAASLACQPPPTPRPTVPPTPLERLAEALGGSDSVLALSGIHYEAEGQRWALLQGQTASERVAVNHYRARVSTDLEGHCRVETRREVDYAGRELRQRYIERLTPVGGVLQGSDREGMGANARDSELSSARVAAGQREMDLLVPHGPVRQALAHGGPVRDGGLRANGRYQLYELAPFEFWVDTNTGRLARMRVLESFAPYQDVWVESRFEGWALLEGSSIPWPQEVSLRVAGREVLVEERLGVGRETARTELEALDFELPSGSRHYEPEARRGRRRHVSLLMAQAAARPIRDRLQLKVDAHELSEGVWHLTGGSHHSLVVEQRGGLILVEAPLDRHRTHALYDWAAELWPGRPITHAIATHHHDDHSGGVREAIGRGAHLIAHESADAFWGRVLEAPSTLEPDALSATGKLGRLNWVGERLTLPDPDRPVTAYSVENCHAADMLVVEAGDWLFVSDLVSPGLSPPLCPLRPIVAELRRGGLKARKVAGGRGGVASIARLLAL